MDARFRALVWSTYFASVCGMQFHPRNRDIVGSMGVESTVSECARIADLMLDELGKRLLTWQSM